MARVWDLQADLESAGFRHGVEQGFWQFVGRSGPLLCVRLFAPDDRSFLLELECSSYGAEPLRGRFVDEQTRMCVATAWPRGNPTFQQWVKLDPGNLFICWDQDRVGIQHHADWRGREAWKKSGNPLVAYLEFMRHLLHNPARGYERRVGTAA
jgi:hypothetical protein